MTRLVLDVPGPPDELPYEQYEDFRYRQICRLNGIAESVAGLSDALRHDQPTLQAAAAHTIGSTGLTEAIPALKSMTTDDLVRAEVGYALARLADDAGRTLLDECLRLPPEDFIAASLAAGYVAQLGNPQGFPVVETALAAENLLIRLVAAKQLYFFIPYEPGVWAWFRRALGDPESDLHWQAITELGLSPEPVAVALLREYAADGPDPAVRARAAHFLRRRGEIDEPPGFHG